MIAPLRTLIVDDEAIARDLLRTLLAENDRVEVVGECSDGTEAVAEIRRLAPDLVLLDIQMPGWSGLDVLSRLDADERPAVIFVTAHDEFAVRAFEVHALDYLLKPVDEDRLYEAIERSAQQIATTRSQRGDLHGLAAHRGRSNLGPEAALEWVVVREGEERLPLRWRDVLHVESAGNYARVHTADRSFLVRSTLRELEERLAPLSFARVHRRALVNVAHIARLTPCGHGDFELVLAGGARVGMSRRYRAQLEELLGDLG